MSPITEGSILALLATTQRDILSFSNLNLQWFEIRIRILVGAITKGLFLGKAAVAPPVLTTPQFNFVRGIANRI